VMGIWPDYSDGICRYLCMFRVIAVCLSRMSPVW
jgi:hypothetical protein